MSFYMIPLGPSDLLSICLILFPSVRVFLSSASVLQCLYINAEAFKKPFSKDQKPAVSLNQSILRETVGGRRVSTWTRGYEERTQRLSLLNQRLWSLISWDSLLWWCHTDTSTPELFFCTLLKLLTSFPCKIKLMHWLMAKLYACHETWDCIYLQESDM